MPVNKLTQSIPQPPKLVSQPDKEVVVGYRLDLTLEETAALVMLLRTLGGNPGTTPRGLFRGIQNKLPALGNSFSSEAMPSTGGRPYFADWTLASKAEFARQVDRLR